MKLLVGLGNPGEKYEKTRHNVGWMLLDEISDSKFELQKQFNAKLLKTNKVILVKPQTFMNSSGESVKKIVDFYKISPSDLYVIHDDLDINLGNYKIQFGKGPELHYGVNSVENELGTKDFWRVRIGVDNRDPENRVHGEVYTLQEFNEEEKTKLKETIGEIINQLKASVNLG